MSDYTAYAEKLEQAGCSTFWFGPTANSEIEPLERLLGVALPEQFADFLRQTGGGGVDAAWITSVDGVASKGGCGTVYGDTKRLREEFDLPARFLVLRVDENEFAWCLDCSPEAAGAVVGIELGIADSASKAAPDFRTYFEQYVEDQIWIEQSS